MRRSILVCCLLMLIPAIARNAASEDTAKAPAAAPAQPAHYYHLNFVVEQLDATGKIVNSRSYLTTVSTGIPHAPMTIKTGSRVPIATGEYSNSKNASALVNTQFQYIDVGIEINVHDAQEIGRQLAFYVSANLSGETDSSVIAGVREPIISQNTWTSSVLIPVGKPTVIFKSDDMGGKGSTQIVVTATRIE